MNDKPWQSESWFQKNIDRLEAIVNTSTPWNVRDQIRAYIAALKAAKESGEK